MSFRYYQTFERTTPIQTDEGIKARSKRGDFAKNWWADRWIKALERLGDSGRLSRGRSYARKGQVLLIRRQTLAVSAFLCAQGAGAGDQRDQRGHRRQGARLSAQAL